MFKTCSNYIIVFTFARVFTKAKTAENFQHLFQRVFNKVNELTGEQIGWTHHYGYGFEAVTMDMDAGQFKGTVSSIQHV
jgi:hypothetical protein